MDVLDNYISNALLSGADYLTDKKAVHTKLVAMISDAEAEALIKLNEKAADGQKDWKDLKLHYEGQGMFALDIKEDLVYTGDRPPQMYWTNSNSN